MIKRLLIPGLAGVLFAIMATIAPAQAEDVRVSLGLSPKHPVAGYSYNKYMEAVKAELGDKIEFKVHYAGALLGLKAMLDGLRDDVADLGILALPYHAAQLRNSQTAANLAMMGFDMAVMSAVTTEFYMLGCQPCLDEMSRGGLVYAGGYATPPYVLIAKKKITTLEEMKGTKMRAGAGLFVRWAQSVGAVPVNMPVSDMYDGFAQGVIDAGVQTVDGLRGYGFWDVAQHVTMLEVGTFNSTALLGYGKPFWQRQPAEVRKVLLDKAPIAIRSVIENYDERLESVIGPAKEKGVTFYDPSPELLAATRDFAKKDLPEVEKIMKTRYKVADPKPLMDSFAALVAKWEKLVKPVRKDYDALQALFEKEIYAKIDRKSWGM